VGLHTFNLMLYVVFGEGPEDCAAFMEYSIRWGAGVDIAGFGRTAVITLEVVAYREGPGDCTAFLAKSICWGAGFAIGGLGGFGSFGGTAEVVITLIVVDLRFEEPGDCVACFETSIGKGGSFALDGFGRASSFTLSELTSGDCATSIVWISVWIEIKASSWVSGIISICKSTSTKLELKLE